MIVWSWTAAMPAVAQNSSLFRQEMLTAGFGMARRLLPPLTLANSSWLYEGVDPPRVFKMNDLITVMVVEASQVSSNNKIQRRKQGQLDATLSNFVKFKGLELVPTVGGQQINGTLQGQFQAQSNLDTKDLMQFSIEARVVDIRPNGHLVLEGHQTMVNNEERWRAGFGNHPPGGRAAEQHDSQRKGGGVKHRQTRRGDGARRLSPRLDVLHA